MNDSFIKKDPHKDQMLHKDLLTVVYCPFQVNK